MPCNACAAMRPHDHHRRRARPFLRPAKLTTAHAAPAAEEIEYVGLRFEPRIKVLEQVGCPCACLPACL